MSQPLKTAPHSSAAGWSTTWSSLRRRATPSLPTATTPASTTWKKKYTHATFSEEIDVDGTYLNTTIKNWIGNMPIVHNQVTLFKTTLYLAHENVQIKMEESQIMLKLVDSANLLYMSTKKNNYFREIQSIK